MRTDVKVGLICAVIVVLCVLLYFFTHTTPKPTVAKPTSSSSSHTSLTEIPPAPAPTPSSAVTGGFIGLPGSSSLAATTAPATAPAAAPPSGLAGAPTAPNMTSSSGLTNSGTGLTGTAGTGISSTFGSNANGTSTYGSLPSSSLGSPAGGLPVTSVAGSSAVRGTLQVLPSDNSSTLGGLTSSTGATTYKIQKGDMLGTVAKKYNVSLRALEAANPGIDSNHLKIDAVIKIPAAATASHTSPTSGDSTHTIASTGGTSTHTTASASTPTGTSVKPGTTYTIKKGDTLRTIAKAAYGSKADGWKKIFQANRAELDDPDVVPVGAKIVIPQ